MWKRVPWVNLWMMVFSAAGIAVVAYGFSGTYGIPGGPMRITIMALVILGTVGLVGFIRLPFTFFYEPGEPGILNLNHLARVYLTAWKGLWRRKWMLRVFGMVAGVDLLAWLIESMLTRRYLAAGGGQFGMHNATPLKDLPGAMAAELAEITTDALGWFSPRTGLSSGTIGIVVISALLILALPWVYLRLDRLRRQAAYSADARFVQWALISLGIIGVAILASVPRTYIIGLQSFAQGDHSHWSAAIRASSRASYAWMLAEVGLSAFLIGGLIGSLKRENERVTLDSFLETAAHYFKPLAGLYLLLAGVAFAFQLFPFIVTGGTPSNRFMEAYLAVISLMTVINLLFLLVPFTIVTGELGAWKGIKRGVREWFSHAGQMISLIALGITFLMPVLLLQEAVSRLLLPFSTVGIAVMPLRVAVILVLTAVMLLAVWGFYRLILGEQEAGHG